MDISHTLTFTIVLCPVMSNRSAKHIKTEPFCFGEQAGAISGRTALMEMRLRYGTNDGNLREVEQELDLGICA